MSPSPHHTSTDPLIGVPDKGFPPAMMRVRAGPKATPTSDHRGHSPVTDHGASPQLPDFGWLGHPRQRRQSPSLDIDCRVMISGGGEPTVGT